MAAARGKTEVAEQLIQSGINLDLQDEVHVSFHIYFVTGEVKLSQYTERNDSTLCGCCQWKQ